MEFVAIDVETANEDPSSICQIGIARCRNGIIVDEWLSLINPNAEFNDINIGIHGITPKMVKKAPTIANVATTINQWLDNTITACHSGFDKTALTRAYSQYQIDLPNCHWINTVRVARRAWPEDADKGFGLAKICARLGHTFQHHSALEDAKAAAKVFHAAILHTGLAPEDWLERVTKPVNPNTPRGKIKLAGEQGKKLTGQTLAFTGALSLPRIEAARIAAKMGCNIAPEVTKKVTVLVVGDQDLYRLNGEEKSTKHKKAEALIAKGVAIEIIAESAFLQMCEMAD